MENIHTNKEIAASNGYIQKPKTAADCIYNQFWEKNKEMAVHFYKKYYYLISNNQPISVITNCCNSWEGYDMGDFKQNKDLDIRDDSNCMCTESLVGWQWCVEHMKIWPCACRGLVDSCLVDSCNCERACQCFKTLLKKV